MCRHLAYLGPPVSLAELVLDPPHSLLRQSYAPNDMRGGGTVNADGFGLGWYPPGRRDGQVRRYRRSVPMWTDASLPDMAGGVRSGAVLAAVRNATAGMPVGRGRVRAVHRRPLAVQPQRTGRGLAGLARRAGLRPPGDGPDDPGRPDRRGPAVGPRPAPAPRGRLSRSTPWPPWSRDVAAAAPASRLNLLLTDGELVVGTTWTHALWTRRTPGAVAVASEPWDPADPAGGGP